MNTDMHDLDIILVNAGGSRKKVYQDLNKDYSAVDTPFWAALTAGYLRGHGFKVDILDANAENLDFLETADRIKRLNPRYIAIICYSQQANVSTPIMAGVGELCRTIKQAIPAQNLILTGWHPSALPERTMKEEACDFVVKGEGFYSLRELLAGKPPGQVPGLWWRESARIMHTEPPRNVRDLTGELGEVAWDLILTEKNHYRCFNWMCLGDLKSRDRFVSMFTSLGCPFQCKFCAIHATYGEHKLRCWSPDWVLRQLDVLTGKYNIRNINLHDELFVFQREHYLPIAEGILKRGYKLNIAAFARVDILDRTPQAELELLKAAGFNWFKLGIETGNQEILKKSVKGGFTRDMIRRVVRKTHAAGIDLCANFMFGLPGDTMETMKENLAFAMELQCAFPSMFCTMAIPGSDLYEDALKNRTPLPDTWLGYASQGYDFMPLPTERLTSAEIVRFRDNAFHTYFSNERYLDMIEKKFGPEAREHIKGMTAIKLKRKILGD